MAARRHFLSVVSLLLCAVAVPVAWAAAGHYSYRGHEASGGRNSNLSFAISPDGSVTGTMSVTKICTNDIKMSGSELTFTGALTGGYPQVSGSFKGTNYHCNGNSSPDQGSIEIGYQQPFGVWVRLGGTNDWYYATNSNPFE